jgi:integral membrane sensor domain MASE1
MTAYQHDMLTLASILVASLIGIASLFALMKRPGPPIPGLPPAPSYAFIAVMGAAYNAIVERSWWATLFCLGLASVFWLGRWLDANRIVSRDVLVVGGGVSVIIASTAWLLAGHPGVQ